MQRRGLILTVLIISLVFPVIAHAQTGNDLIVLNDTTPGIDVVINPGPNTTGVVAVEVDNASVIVTDAVGNIVFEAATPNIKALEFHFAPNAGMHTLSVERLPGATQAYSRISALAEMTSFDVIPRLIDGSNLEFVQEVDRPLDANSPSTVIDFNIPDQNGMITANFPGAPVTAQLVNTQNNSTVATLYGSLIDGVRLTVGSGAYEMVLVNNNSAERETVASVSLVPASNTDFAALVMQAGTANTTTMTDSASVAPTSSDTTVMSDVASGSTPLSDTTACTMVVSASSVNLRSGPGTGYSVLGYAFRGDSLPVGGVNPESGWLLAGTESTSGWMADTLGVLSGNCESLPAYYIPYREALAPQVTIQQPQVPIFHEEEDDDRFEHEQEHDN